MSHRTRGMTYEFSGERPPIQRTDLVLMSPKRISITVPHNTYERLLKRSDYEGRSLSNLAAFLLEEAIDKQSGNR